MNRRSFIKFAATAIASLFVKPQQVDPEWRFAPMSFDEGERKIYMGDELLGNWEEYVTLEEPFRFETGCGEPANWTTPKHDSPQVLLASRHTYCVRWDADGVRYDVDGQSVSQEEFESHDVKFTQNDDCPQGTIVWWTYE